MNDDGPPPDCTEDEFHAWVLRMLLGDAEISTPPEGDPLHGVVFTVVGKPRRRPPLNPLTYLAVAGKPED